LISQSRGLGVVYKRQPPRTAKDWKSYLKTNLLSPKNLLAYLNFRSKLNQIIKR
jgi:hypothetical protein